MKAYRKFAPTLIGLAVASVNAAELADDADRMPVEASTLAQALSDGEANVQLRFRQETVEERGALDSAYASTIKSRFTFETARLNGFTAALEVDNVAAIGSEDYDSTRNGESKYSVVADPEGTDINQAWIAYDGILDTTAKYGRQRISLDNQRFVGGNDWRQNEQTFDGLTLVNKSIDDLTASYGYIYRVNTVFGPEQGSPEDQVDMQSHIFNVNYAGLPFGQLTGYGYFLDFDDSAAMSTSTVGLRLAGEPALNENMSFAYAVEYARQQDDANNPVGYEVDYYLLEGGLGTKQWSAKLGFEVMEGDADKGVAFQTPLAGSHAFQGWTDQFDTTPAGGVEDRYVSASVALPIIDSRLNVAYHDFKANESSSELGSEWNVGVTRSFGKRFSASLKYAEYEADSFGVDTDKVWLQVQFDL